jgi:ADP-ribosylglycohydrolase
VDRPLTEVITQVIECGGDTDTNASVAGQIAGAAAGAQTDSDIHFSRIVGCEEVRRLTDRFADFLCSRQL